MKKVSRNYSIDAVIAWVDGNDPKWQKQKAKYSGEYSNPESTNNARFRSWDNLHLLVRGIQKNLPWIRNIFIVTNGQIPSFYDPNDSQIKLVFHKDFIDKKYLPTFSANPIELNLHHIKGLSEHFIFFNDDMFIINKMKKEDFFRDGLPCDFGILSIHCQKKSLMIYDICNNDVSLINEHFDFKDTIQNNYKKWFNPKYGLKYNIQNLTLKQCPRFPGFKNFHLPQPFLKSTFYEIWEKEPEVLNEVCEHKFRSRDDVNQWLVKSWQICTGKFFPAKVKNRGILIDFEKNDEQAELQKCLKIIRGNKYKMICVNDGDTIMNYTTIKDQVNTALEQKLGDRQ